MQEKNTATCLPCSNIFPHVFTSGHCQRWNTRVGESFIFPSRITALTCHKFGPSVALCEQRSLDLDTKSYMCCSHISETDHN